MNKVEVYIESCQMFSFTFNLHSVFFYGFKNQLSNSYDNQYVQKYLKGIFHKGMLLIGKECFTHVILSFTSPRCVIIACLNVIYTKFRHAMITQLNKIWRVWACACAITCHSQPGLTAAGQVSHCGERRKAQKAWKKFFFFFFNCYLAVPQPTLGHSQGDGLTNPMLIIAYIHIRPEGITGGMTIAGNSDTVQLLMENFIVE